MKKDKVFELLNLVSTIDLEKETAYSLDELKCLLSAYCRRELEETESFVVNSYYNLPGTKLKVSMVEEEAIIKKVIKKFRIPYRKDGFSYFIGLKKKEEILPAKPEIHLDQSVRDLPMPLMVTNKLIDAGILTVNQLVNLTTMELLKILRGHRSYLKWVYKMIGNEIVFNSDKGVDGMPPSNF